MIIAFFLLGNNPFYQAFLNADLLGKAIFLFLLLLSVISWVLIIHKAYLARSVRTLSTQFAGAFERQKAQPLKVAYDYKGRREVPHPYFDLYTILKKQTLEILAKNRHFGAKEKGSDNSPFLSHSDMELVESHLESAISSHGKVLESHLYILSMVVSLSPFLGLLGTVWGILTSFSEMQAASGGNTSQMVLQGLSLALATTVLGLMNAIPALVGYNYLKNSFREYQTEMESFANQILSTVELHYRQVDTVR